MTSVQIEEKKITISFVFLCLFILSHYISPSTYIEIDNIPQILILVSIAAFFLETITGKIDHKFNNSSFVFILIVTALTFYTTYFCSVDTERSYDLLYGYFLKGVLIFFLISNIVKNELQFKIILLVLIIGAVFISFSITNLANWHHGRAFIDVSSIAGDPNAVAMLLTYHLPFVGYFYVMTNKKTIKLLCAIIFFYLLLGLVQTESRGGFLAFSVISFSILIFIPNTNKKFMYMFILCIVGIFFILRYVPIDYYYRMQEIFYPDADSTGSALLRARAMTDTFTYILSNPFSDYGPGNHSYYLFGKYNPDFDYINAQDFDIFRGSYLVHNMYLQFGADNGLIPLTAYIIFIISVFKKSLQTTKILKKNSDDPSHKSLYILSYSLRISILGFLAGAFFLALAYKFYIFYLSGLIIALYKITSLREASSCSK